jgi:hypothetical protein
MGDLRQDIDEFEAMRRKDARDRRQTLREASPVNGAAKSQALRRPPANLLYERR